MTPGGRTRGSRTHCQPSASVGSQPPGPEPLPASVAWALASMFGLWPAVWRERRFLILECSEPASSKWTKEKRTDLNSVGGVLISVMSLGRKDRADVATPTLPLHRG